MKQYEMYEMQFLIQKPVGSEVEIDLQAEFQNGTDVIRVKGFYKGNGICAVRFLPQSCGAYQYKISGIVEKTGKLFCESSGNAHGLVKTEGTHFVYEDGTSYCPFGTTIYALAHQPEELIFQTMETLKQNPFNKVRCCIFPKSYDYNHNEPEFFPFEKTETGAWDVHRPCYEFWNHFEKLIFQMQKMNIQIDLILFHSYDRWGFTFLSLQEWLVYLDYVLRRLSAIPNIWWSMANEYDFIFNHDLSEWPVIEEFIRNHDPYGHLLSNHNGMKLYDYSRSSITHCSIQTNAIHMAEEWQKRFGKPVVLDEICYEGDIEHEWGNISAFEMVNRFWKTYIKGAYASHGETYYAEDEVLWWAKGGKLKGESPKRIAFLKDIILKLPGPIEAWNEPFFEDFYNPTEKAVSSDVPPFVKLMLSLTEEERTNLNWKNARYTGCVKDEVFLRYFGEACPVVGVIHLPMEQQYRIEMIDVWEMTRTTILSSASGKTTFNLPGKAGIAVICTRM